MTGYLDDEALNAEAMRGGYYHTGDVATSEEDGYITYVGRTDDVFKASDYRISPFELESILIEHEAVAEAAVVPSPDPVRLAVPKAYILLAADREPSPELAQSIMAFCRERVASYKRIRRVEFGDLPKTISGKIRRVELRAQETGRPSSPSGTTTPGGTTRGTTPPRHNFPPRHHRILGRRFHLVTSGPALECSALGMDVTLYPLYWVRCRIHALARRRREGRGREAGGAWGRSG